MTRQLLLRPAALVAAAATFVAACGGTTPTTAPATTGASSTETPATQAPAASGLPGFSFDLPSEAKDLEDLIPDQIAGETVTKSSMRGSSVGQGSDDIEKMLADLGKTPEDISAAFGSTAKASFVIFRIAGVDSNTLFNAFLGVAEPADVAQVSDVTIAGKSVKKVVNATGVTTTYLYMRGDALITVTSVQGDDPQLLDEIFSKLP